MTFPDVPHYVSRPPTKENCPSLELLSSRETLDLKCASTMEYADLAIIDISKADTEEGRAALAIEVRDALLKYGFFYVNHGYSEAQVR
jgi:hypothetical protein